MGRAAMWRWGFKSCPREGASYKYTTLVSLCQCFKSCPREGASDAVMLIPPISTLFQVVPP